MNKYEAIKKIMESKKINADEKVHTIETFLKGWLSVEDIKWIWE